MAKQTVSNGRMKPQPEPFDTSRPGVKVVIPQIKITLQDLAFLRSLAQPRSLRCHPGSKTIDKLRFLDLIAKAPVPPTPQTVSEVAKSRIEWENKFNTAHHSRDWKAVHSISYELGRLDDRLKPSEDDVLTEKGKKLLESGEVEVRVRKIGCV